jgi:hypothetical protein
MLKLFPLVFLFIGSLIPITIGIHTSHQEVTIGMSSSNQNLAKVPKGQEAHSEPDWGFFAHRRINRMAVFTLPPEMMVFYKKHIEYITDHAVDPDKRRYATKHEAVRHYIDIDQWGTLPFDNLPRTWTDVLLKYAKLYVVTSRGDTLNVIDNESIDQKKDFLLLDQRFLRRLDKDRKMPPVAYDDYRRFFSSQILPQYYEDEWMVDLDSLNALLQVPVKVQSAFMEDKFSEHGILPYHLEKMQRDLTHAFKHKNAERILRLSAEFGHYIGDAHVPLHTTTNYNGQLTNQVGIHGFWESRIPELFADEQFDYFVGKADYIEKPRDYYWNIVLTSHALVDSVLLIEKSLSRTFSEDQIYCYDDRGEATIRTYCKAYANAFNKRMDGMVESRMRASIEAIGEAWYTAWVDAGQPNLRNISSDEALSAEDEALQDAFRSGKIKGREHN